MHTNQKFRLSFISNQWGVCSRDGSPRIPVDTAIVDVTYQSPNHIEGYIVAVHGLDQEVAKYLDSQTLRDLGVGAQVRRAPRLKTRRAQLNADGSVEWTFPPKGGK